MKTLRVYRIKKTISTLKEHAVMIWFDGCSIRCEGCFNKHLWNGNHPEATEFTPEQLAEAIKTFCKKNQNVKTVIFSGGEPLDQPIGLILDLMGRLKPLKILIYTGYTKDKILSLGKSGRTLIDSTACLMSGTYKGSETGLQDKDFYGDREYIEWFLTQKENITCEVVIDPETGKASVMGYKAIQEGKDGL